MSEEAVVEQTESEVDSQILAGYNRGETAPVEPEPKTEPEKETVEPQPEPEAKEEIPQPEPETGADGLTDEQRKAMFEELPQLRHQSQETQKEIRKLHGTIGELKGIIKQFQSPTQTAPARQDVADALKQAKEAAKEFPELTAIQSLITAVESLSAREAQEAKPTSASDGPTVTEILSEFHPDWQELRDTKPQDYQDWLGTLTASARARFLNSSDPYHVAEKLDEFKAWREKAQAAATSAARDTKRVAAAVTPTKGTAPPQSNVLPDEAGILVGYNKRGR